MAKILIVEDEKSIADLIELNLSLTGHTCQWAPLAEDALKQTEDWQPDLILLDVMLPGKDGFELISELNRFDIPVIFLTARQSVVDKVQGLRLGAEDYITKPFEPAELLARIEVVLRRAGKSSGKLQICGVEINLMERSVSRRGQPVELTAQEYNLMEALVRNRNIALSREKLLETAWGFDFAGETRTVDIHIQRLRRKLDWENCLKTVYKYGYRLESDG